MAPVKSSVTVAATVRSPSARSAISSSRRRIAAWLRSFFSAVSASRRLVSRTITRPIRMIEARGQGAEGVTGEQVDAAPAGQVLEAVGQLRGLVQQGLRNAEDVVRRFPDLEQVGRGLEDLVHRTGDELEEFGDLVQAIHRLGVGHLGDAHRRVAFLHALQYAAEQAGVAAEAVGGLHRVSRRRPAPCSPSRGYVRRAATGAGRPRPGRPGHRSPAGCRPPLRIPPAAAGWFRRGSRPPGAGTVQSVRWRGWSRRSCAGHPSPAAPRPSAASPLRGWAAGMCSRRR